MTPGRCSSPGPLCPLTLGSKPHPQPASYRFLFSAWLFQSPLFSVFSGDLLDSSSCPLNGCPLCLWLPIFQPLALGPCSPPYPAFGRALASLNLPTDPRRGIWVYASALTFSPTPDSWIHNLLPTVPPENQRAIWNAKLSSSFLLLSPGSQPCFCSSVFALVWNSISPGIHWDCFLILGF